MSEPARAEAVARQAAEAHLSAALALQLEREAAHETRVWRAHVMALLSVPLGALALWPGAFGELWRRAVVVAWGLSACSLVLGLVDEARLAARDSPAR